MITLEQFKNIFKHIQELEERNDKLSSILVCKESGGWISYGDEMITDILELLQDSFNLPSDDDLFSWWLYDISDGHKFSYFNGIKYDLNSLDDLYLYAKGEYEKVKQTKDTNPEPIYEASIINLNNIEDLVNLNSKNKIIQEIMNGEV